MHFAKEALKLDLQISHLNFQQQRKSYGITLQEIADEAMLSITTVRNYEVYGGSYLDSRVRDENERRICRALKELINMRIDSCFVRGSIKSTLKKMKEERKMASINSRNNFDRAKVKAVIIEYLHKNNISMSEFLKMCGINAGTFSDATIKDHPSLYPATVVQICKATGWNIATFNDCKMEWKEEPKMEKPKTENVEFVKKGATIIKNHKFVFENGKFFEEYDIVQSVKKIVSKEDFMAAIQKEEN